MRFSQVKEDAGPSAQRRLTGAIILSVVLLWSSPVHPPGAQAGTRVSTAALGGGWAAGDPKDAPEPGPIHRAANAPPWPKDFEVGLQAARAFAHQFGLVENDTVLARVDRIGYRVAGQTGHPEILFTFHVLDTPEPNALALPGGFIFLTKGMTDLNLPDAALANVLGHEIGHVVRGHFGRAGRFDSALSLLQTAVMVAALVAVPTSTSGGIDRDPATGEYRTSLSGKEAAIQGTSIFGSVFRELLERGYSRDLEMEADEMGRRYAGRAGYPVSGSVQLLEELHRRIYEDQEFGYWNTHPYFVDRLTKAQAAVNAGGEPPSPQEIWNQRDKLSKHIFQLAQSIQDEPTALFLYRSALQASPDSVSAFEVEHKLLQVRAERLRKQKPILRAYGPLLAGYDSLLVRLERVAPPPAILAPVNEERSELEKERLDTRGPALEILNRPQAGTVFLELFLKNFPADTLAPNVRLRLAEQYRLTDRPDAAAMVLAEPLKGAESGASIWRPADQEELRRILPLTKELTTNAKLLQVPPSDSVRTWAAARLKAQAASLDSLEIGSRFLLDYPESPVSPKVAAKLEELAMKRYYAARLRESMRDFQDALDGYNSVIILGPGTKAAQMAREGVVRIQSLANR
jgi:predicted Zn-dependent protease